MQVTGEVNPIMMEFNDIKIGDKVAIELTAFHWLEAATEIHALMRVAEHSPMVLQQLMGKIFEAMTPESYRKALHAEHAEMQEKAMQQHPLFGLFNNAQIMPDPDEFDDGNAPE